MRSEVLALFYKNLIYNPKRPGAPRLTKINLLAMNPRLTFGISCSFITLGVCTTAAVFLPYGARADQVIADDLIVIGSSCFGLDCADGEDFGFDTLRLKENNLRIKFDDTSSSSSFPNNDWEIVINDSANGGENFFSIVDSTAGTTLFKLCAEADTSCEGINPLGTDSANTSAIQSNTSAIQSNTSSINVLRNDVDGNRRKIEKNTKEIKTNRANINNLGDGIAASTALTTALSALPVTPDDAPFSCGVGTGGYSSRYAMGIGCATRLNDRLSINIGGSHVFGGSSNYGGGSLDTFAARAGVVFKLGTIHKSATSNEEQLQSQLDEVRKENASMKVKYDDMAEQNQELIARLERLEAIALGSQPETTTASLK